MRLLMRLMGLLALAGAFAAAVLDGARWIANGDFTPMTAAAALELLSPRALANAQSVVTGRLGAWAWGDLARGLQAPLFLYLTALSALLFVLSRQRRSDSEW